MHIEWHVALAILFAVIVQAAQFGAWLQLRAARTYLRERSEQALADGNYRCKWYVRAGRPEDFYDATRFYGASDALKKASRELS